MIAIVYIILALLLVRRVNSLSVYQRFAIYQQRFAIYQRFIQGPGQAMETKVVMNEVI
jgi:hypothetical protein